MWVSTEKTHFIFEGIETPASYKEKNQEPLSGKTRAVIFGLIIAVIGSIIAGSYAKDTIINYAGFSMLLAGIAVSVLGIFAEVATTLKAQLNQEAQANVSVNKPKMLLLSVWSIGIGVALAINGSILASAFAKDTQINGAGFGMLLSGICVFVLGFFGTMLATLRTRINQDETSLKVDRPRFLFSSILSMGVGTALTIVGSILSRSYAKETMMNFTGFGLLLTGIAVLSLGISGTVVVILKNRLDLNWLTCEDQPRIEWGSIWAIGIGSMLVIIGSLLAGSYAKESLLNYTGFGMLLAGTGVFVYGVFETARISAMDFLNRKRTVAKTLSGNLKECESKGENFPQRLRTTWRNWVASRAVLNVAGIMVAMGLLFFSLWQLDLIVSGPVWWSSLPQGQGQGWSHPNGAYANDYFQSFLWKTTVGQAYDTLFLLIFISFIVIFASAFFWPRLRNPPEIFKKSEN